jgi:hypothetical protein
MKKALFTTLLFSTGILTLQAQESRTAAVNETVDPNAPEIVFDKEVHDFGTIEYGGNGMVEFRFTNTGKNPLIITSATGSCGCTVPSHPKEPIRRGESGIIKVSYDTKRVGAFTKTVTVNSNARTPTKILTIKGTVLSQEETENLMPVKKTKTGAPVENTATPLRRAN